MALESTIKYSIYQSCTLTNADPNDGSSSSSSSSSSGNHQGQGPQPMYHGSIGNHQMDDSIDVSSSIGVSNNGGGEPVAHKPGHVEDLIANESGDGDGPRIIAAPIGPGPIAHSSHIDSDQDLIQAESEPKFSLSKLKRPFTRLSGLDSLRFNNRFLQGAASILHPQIHSLPGQGPPQGNFRHGPPQPGMPRPNFRPGPPLSLPQGHMPPFGHMGGPFKMPPPQNQPQFNPQFQPQQQQQQQQQQPQQNGRLSMGPMPSQGATYHLIEEPQGSNGHNGDSDIVHSISDFIASENENARQNELNDFDNRPPMSSPSNDIWPLSQPDLAKIVNLDVKCDKNYMKVSIEFDRPYNGMIFSKGHFSSTNCIHLPAGSGRTHVYFDIRMDACGTTGNMGSTSLIPTGPGSAGNFFENTVIFQYDPFVQEAWDQARKLRCTWHDSYEKSVSFRPFPVDMVDVVRADFAGDNVGCWMQIQVGRGPWASEVAGIVKIGQTMTMVLAIKDEENKFDMLVRNCVAHDGKRAPIELVDANGCIVRSKLMSRFTKIKNFGSSASVLSYAHFQAFKFPDSMEVHFQCTIQICKNSCLEQCDTTGASNNVHYVNHQISGTINTATGNIQNHQIQPVSESLYIDPSTLVAAGSEPVPSVLARPREIRDVSKQESEISQLNQTLASKEVGVNKVIRVVSNGDLSFSTSDKLTQNTDSINESMKNESKQIDGAKSWLSERINEKICMSSLSFFICFAVLVLLLLISCTCSVVICCRRRSNDDCSKKTKKTAKESALTAKMVLGSQSHQTRSDYPSPYGHLANSSTSSGASVSHNGYLGSSSVLSPRVQANGGYATSSVHHRSSDLYHS
ncbi:hypothetical protein BLOT_009011 [Blomia tropicalis]|nr:hypothetical protein BLOT_009011 [Blomia tropicalis]